MAFLIVLAALCFLMLVAYRGYSVILFAPIAALGAVLLTDPSLVPPMFSSVFMEKMVGFVKNFFPVFLLGAVFGKVIELLPANPCRVIPLWDLRQLEIRRQLLGIMPAEHDAVALFDGPRAHPRGLRDRRQVQAGRRDQVGDQGRLPGGDGHDARPAAAHAATGVPASCRDVITVSWQLG